MFSSKINMKLYPMYIFFSWDLLFYYAISFLFLTQEKGFSASQVLLADGSYVFFKLFVQLFCIVLVDKLGKKNSLICGNLAVALSVYLIIIASNINYIFVSFFIMAFGYSLKDLSESTLLYNSIPHCSSRSKIFAKLDSKGTSAWYVADALTSVCSSFLFVINAYIPMYLCIFMLLMSAIIGLGFENDDNVVTQNCNEDNDDIPEDYSSQNLKNYIKDLKYAFRFIFKSSRLRALLMFSVLFYSTLSISSTLRSSLLTDLQVPAQYFGIFLAVYQIIASICSRKQEWFHNKFKNKLLSYFSITMCVVFISAGLIGKDDSTISIILVLLLFTLHYITKGPYYTLMKKYLTSFSNRDIRTKIFSAQTLLISIFSPVIIFFASFLLDHLSTSNTLIILGFVLLVAYTLVLRYMKTRVGLKPEEYKKSDIEYVKAK